MTSTSSATPVKLFCAYHDADLAFFERLGAHLKPLVQSKVIEILHSGSVPPGAVKRDFLTKTLAGTEIVVLLVTADLTSDELWSNFWIDVVSRINPERARLVPILVRHVDLTNTCLEGQQLLPRHSKVPLIAFSDHDTAWTDITKEIREAAHALRPTPAAGAAGDGSPARGDGSLEDVKNRKDRAHDLKYRGRIAEALEQLHLAQATLDELINKRPDNTLLIKERAHLHDRIGQCESSRGHFEDALRSFKQAFVIRTELCASLPDDAEAQFDCSTSHFWLGNLHYLLGNRSQARDEQRAGWQRCRTLYEGDENNLKAARSLVVLETDLGTTLQELKDRDGAEKHLRGALALVRKLAAQNPQDWQLQRDLSVGLFRLADLLVTLGETTEASSLCEESIQRGWALTKLAPANVQWRSHLATARISMGDVRLSCEELNLARGDYEFSTGTMGALAVLDLDNLQMTRHYANSEKKLGRLLGRARDHGAAMAAHTRAASAMEAACRIGNSERWNGELLAIYDELLNAHAAVPGAAPEIAASVRAKAEHLRARLPDAAA